MIRILIADSSRLVGNLITAVLKDEDDIKVVDAVTTAEEALNQLENCDMIILGTTLADDEVLTFICDAKEAYPELHVLVIGLRESEKTILTYIEAGVSGYVLKDDSEEELLQTIRAIDQGEALVSPKMVAAMMSRLDELTNVCDDPAIELEEDSELTPREVEVLDLIADELSNREIADKLVIEVGTVKNHVHNILQKLNVRSRWDAVPYLEIQHRNGTS